MTPLQLKELKVQLAGVYAARMSQEYKVDERMEEIGRIKVSIQVQLDKEDELKQKIAEAEAKQEG